MKYGTHDTEWDDSAQGNKWRRLNEHLLIARRKKHSPHFWASVDSRFIDDVFDSLEQAQLAAEKEAQRLDDDFFRRISRESN